MAYSLSGMRVTSSVACWTSWWAFLAHRQGRVCLPLWPVGTAGEPFWYGGKGECVCRIGLLDQLVGLFGTEARARVYAFLAGGHRAPDDAPDDDFVF